MDNKTARSTPTQLYCTRQQQDKPNINQIFQNKKLSSGKLLLENFTSYDCWYFQYEQSLNLSLLFK